jgi:LCP family protein required for cell wall assembly
MWTDSARRLARRLVRRWPGRRASTGSRRVPAPRDTRWWVFRGLAGLVGLVVLLAAGTAVYSGSVSHTFGANVRREAALLPADPGSGATTSAASQVTRPAKAKTDAENYVLIGSDSRDPSNPNAGRTDSLMVLHLDADRQHAYLVSFPRDLWVPVPGNGRHKINAAIALGGPALAVATLEQLLQTRMDHVALVDVHGFLTLADDLGGVSVHNDTAATVGRYDFGVGEITLDGASAAAYVRERYDQPNGDAGQAERQRLVIKAILEKGLSGSTLSDPATFNTFISKLAQHVTVDADLSNNQVRGLALTMRPRLDDVTLLQAPTAGLGETAGQSVDVVDQARLTELAAALKADKVADYVAKYPER